MFLTNTVALEFDGLEFCVKVPGNSDLTAIFDESTVLAQADKITPATFAKMASLIAPHVIAFPDIWANLPEITQTRLLFEVAKFVLNEALTVPQLKKK